MAELVIDCPRCGHCCPQRQWVGLTDEDKQELAAEQHSWESLCFAVEAKLKEKNT
jgi:Fe-S-cluster containining protein